MRHRQFWSRRSGRRSALLRCVVSRPTAPGTAAWGSLPAAREHPMTTPASKEADTTGNAPCAPHEWQEWHVANSRRQCPALHSLLAPLTASSESVDDRSTALPAVLSSLLSGGSSPGPFDLLRQAILSEAVCEHPSRAGQCVCLLRCSFKILQKERCPKKHPNGVVASGSS